MAANIRCGSLSCIADHYNSALKNCIKPQAKKKVGLNLAKRDQQDGSQSENTAVAVETWQLNVYRRVDREMGLAGVEFEDEMRLLRTLVDALRTFRRRLSSLRFD